MTSTEHICCICGHHFHSQPHGKSSAEQEAVKVRTAVKVNGTGPFCLLCLYLEMACRHADLRGEHGLREVIGQWRAVATPAT